MHLKNSAMRKIEIDPHWLINSQLYGKKGGEEYTIKKKKEYTTNT